MPRPVPREILGRLPAYLPGKPATARPGLVTYKLSSNENPYPPLPAVLEAAVTAAATLNRYPDMGMVALYDALAGRLGVEPPNLAAGTGSVAVLYSILQAFCDPGDEVVYAWRSFEAYPIAATVNAATSVQVPLTATGEHDLDAMADAITERTKVVLVCTPNNPTGPAITQGALRTFLGRVPGRVLVVVDEAYREFVRSGDPVDAVALLDRFPNVVSLRTLAKAFGLAGLRVGYAVGSPDLVAAIRACSLPFGVSGVAQAAALAAIEHEASLLAQVDALVQERVRVVAGLMEAGWDLPDAQGNFVWLPLGGRGPDFVAAADAAGITVRPFPEGVRVSIGETEANDRLLDVAADFP